MLLQVLIDLPNTKVKQVDLQVHKEALNVLTPTHRLNLTLPHPVSPFASAQAKQNSTATADTHSLHTPPPLACHRFAHAQVDDKEGSAQWIADKEQLRVTLPVKRDYDFLLS